jgi:hypothetical protein
VNKGQRLDPLTAPAGPLPIGVREIGNTASDHFFSDLRRSLQLPGPHYVLPVPPGRLRPAGRSVAWYKGPADEKQSGQNQIAGTHPNPLARTDTLGYRALYAALTRLFPI